MHKTTIYRTWTTKDEVLADALVQAPELTLAIPDTGSLRGDLVELAKQIHRLLSDPANRRVITAVVSALPDRPATAEAAGRFFADCLGREQGRLRPCPRPRRTRRRRGFGDDPGSARRKSLVPHPGPGESADDTYLERLVDTVLTGVAR